MRQLKQYRYLMTVLLVSCMLEKRQTLVWLLNDTHDTLHKVLYNFQNDVFFSFNFRKTFPQEKRKLI